MNGVKETPDPGETGAIGGKSFSSATPGAQDDDKMIVEGSNPLSLYVSSS